VTLKEKIGILDKVEKSYTLGKVEVPALKGVSLDLYKNDFLVILGPSGSGKSTLLNIIGLLDMPTTGYVEIFGKSVQKLTKGELCKIRRERIGFIFQDFSLIEVLTVEENVIYPFLLQGVSQRVIKERVENILDFMGVLEYRNRRPTVLSGGERQRVAIARAMISEPDIIVADEFTANLDSKISREILDMMEEYHGKNTDTTIIIASHDPIVEEYAERTIHLKDGIMENGHQ